MQKKFRGRESFRERLEKNNAADSFYAAMAGIAPKCQAAIPEKRARIRRPVDGKPAVPLERDVLRAVLAALRLDPRVARVERSQSGVFKEGERYVRVGERGKLDITGMLKGGRYFEIECKRPGAKPDPRQAERIQQIKAQGGISGYCWSVESALALLP